MENNQSENKQTTTNRSWQEYRSSFGKPARKFTEYYPRPVPGSKQELLQNEECERRQLDAMARLQEYFNDKTIYG
jgi:hypothetical protein